MPGAWITQTRSTSLAASPQEAWAYVVDHGDDLESLRFVPRSDQGVGVLNDLGLRVPGLRRLAVSETVEWSPPQRCTFQSVRPRVPVQARIVEEFADAGDGTTDHTISYSARSTVPGFGPLARLMAAAMIRDRARYQEALRAALATPS